MPVLFSQTGNCGVVFFSIERYGLRYTLAHHTLYQSPPNASHSHVRYFPIYVAETSNFIENTANWRLICAWWTRVTVACERPCRL